MFKDKYILYHTIEGFLMVYLTRGGRLKIECVEGKLKRNVMSCFTTKITFLRTVSYSMLIILYLNPSVISSLALENEGIVYICGS